MFQSPPHTKRPFRPSCRMAIVCVILRPNVDVHHAAFAATASNGVLGETGGTTSWG